MTKEANNCDLENNIRNLASLAISYSRWARRIVRCSRVDFKKYMSWFFEKTREMDLYHDKVEGAALAHLLYAVSNDYGVSLNFNGVRQDELENLAQHHIDLTAYSIAETVAQLEYEAPFLCALFMKTIGTTMVPESKGEEYYSATTRLAKTLEPRLKEMYHRYITTTEATKHEVN